MKTISMKTQNENIKEVTITIIKMGIIFLFIAWNLNAFAQDTIIMKNEIIVLAKVIEVSPSEVKCNRAIDSEGIVYVYNTNDIFQIKYQNGITEKFLIKEPIMKANKIQERRIEPRMMNDREMFGYMESKNNAEIDSHIARYKISKGCQNIGFVAIPCAVMGTLYYSSGILGAAWGAEGSDKNMETGNYFMAAGAFCISSSIYFGVDKKIQKKKAMQKYNEMYMGE